MKHALGALLLLPLCSCSSIGMVGHRHGDLIGLDSFALAARHGIPTRCRHQGEYLQLNYGSATVGCRVIALIGQDQRVADRESSGAALQRRGESGCRATPLRSARSIGQSTCRPPIVTWETINNIPYSPRLKKGLAYVS